MVATALGEEGLVSNGARPHASGRSASARPDLDTSLKAADRAHAFAGTATSPCALAAHTARGAWIEDVAGSRYLDLYGNNCHHIGYGEPRLLRALHDQMDRLTFSARGVTNEPAAALASDLASLVGWPGARVVATRSGADAIEVALSIARASTGRYKTISFYDSYHGRSAGALSLGGRRADREGLGPLLPGALHAPSFYPSGAEAGGDPEASARASLAAIRVQLEQEGDVAALVGETVRNNPHVPPSWFWPEVRALCDAHGALLVLDEIATGLGKTGALLNFQRAGVRPDIVVLGKALGGAVMPLAAVVADGRLDTPRQLNVGYFTHEKNPLCAVAGSVTLSILQSDALPDRAGRLGALLAERMDALAATSASVARVRSVGLMAAVDLAGEASAAVAHAARINAECLRRSVLLVPPRGGTVSLSAPLIVDRSELLDAVDILQEAIAVAA